jgi:plasmid replication initiation protein
MQIVSQDADLYTYKVSINNLADMLGIPTQNLYRDVYNMCKHLLQEVVEVGDGNPKHKWKMFQWCSSCKYENGVITIRLHDDLKPYLLQLTRLYKEYILEDVLLLKSVYSIRLYELIMQEIGYTRKKVYADKDANVFLSIDTIRKATDTEDRYEKINHFKERVIDDAIEEINEKLGYYITYTPVKESRKFIGFNFNIKSKVYAEMLQEEKQLDGQMSLNDFI